MKNTDVYVFEEVQSFVIKVGETELTYKPEYGEDLIWGEATFADGKHIRFAVGVQTILWNAMRANLVDCSKVSLFRKVVLGDEKFTNVFDGHR